MPDGSPMLYLHSAFRCRFSGFDTRSPTDDSRCLLLGSACLALAPLLILKVRGGEETTAAALIEVGVPPL